MNTSLPNCEVVRSIFIDDNNIKFRFKKGVWNLIRYGCAVLFTMHSFMIIEYYKFLRLNFSYGILSILRLIKSCSRLLHDLGEAVDFYIIGEKTILWGKDSKESNRRIHSHEKITIRNDLIVFISWCKPNPFLQRNARFKCVKSVNLADCFVGTMANTQ